ncbi:Transcription factor DIVARICATA, partial [Mucuna pruriens]
MAPPSRRKENAGNPFHPIQRKKVIPWSTQEHMLFLHGLKIYGKGNWKRIAQVVKTRTSIQVASHAQKYYLRLNSVKEKKRSSIHDINFESLNSYQHNSEHPIQQLHEIHQPQKMIGLQSDNLLGLEDKFIDQHINQYNWSPQKIIQLPHEIDPDPINLGPLSDIQYLSHYIDSNNLDPLPNIQYLSGNIDPNNLGPLSDMQYLPHYSESHDDLTRLSDIQYIPHHDIQYVPHEVNPEAPPNLQIQPCPYFIDRSSWVPTQNNELTRYLDQQMLQEIFSKPSNENPGRSHSSF